MTPGRKPVIAITMGDAAGIGPEIIIKALSSPDIVRLCRPVVIGDVAVLDSCRSTLAPDVRLEQVGQPGKAGPKAKTIEVIQPEGIAWEKPVLGKATPQAGKAAVRYIETGASLVMSSRADALVTAPINKEAIRLAGSLFPGHTEMLAQITGAGEVAMMLVGGSLRVSLATIHIPLAEVPRELSQDRILSVIQLTHRAVISMGFPGPRVAICGLNPHAGEGGLFGQEEEDIIKPAVSRAADKGIDVVGPLPADTVFHRSLKGDFQAVVAMYHDQGLAPLKTLYFEEGVNVTLGLPIIRTSVDHGTAYDIAGKGIASPRSLVEAIRLAALMAMQP